MDDAVGAEKLGDDDYTQAASSIKEERKNIEVEVKEVDNDSNESFQISKPFSPPKQTKFSSEEEEEKEKEKEGDGGISKISDNSIPSTPEVTSNLKKENGRVAEDRLETVKNVKLDEMKGKKKKNERPVIQKIENITMSPFADEISRTSNNNDFD